jgi:hypothetical protein
LPLPSQKVKNLRRPPDFGELLVVGKVLLGETRKDVIGNTP